MNAKIILCCFPMMLLFPYFVEMPVFAPSRSIAVAQDDWKTEFDATCQVQGNGSVPAREELSQLIRRCDDLKVRFEKLDDPHRKVMLSRLKRCREYYVFLQDYAFLVRSK